MEMDETASSRMDEKEARKSPFINKKPIPELGSQVKIRSCLRCDKEFKSEGPSNRICPHCSMVNASVGRRVECGGSRQAGSITHSKGN